MHVVVPILSTDVCLLAEITAHGTLRFLERCQFTEAPRVHERGFLTGPVLPYRDGPSDRGDLLVVIDGVYEALERQRLIVGEAGWNRLLRDAGMDRLPIYANFHRIEEFEKLSFSLLKLVRIENPSAVVQTRDCVLRLSVILATLRGSGSDSALALPTTRSGNLRFSILLILVVIGLFLLKGFTGMFSLRRQYIIG